MKNKLKITIIFMLLIMTILSVSAYAVNFGQADDFINQGKNSEDGIKDLTEIGKEFSTIGNILTYIGAGVLVGATAYMGILYMVSPPERQAKLKQQAIGLVVSAIVIFGAYAIWNIVVSFLDKTIG